MHFADVTGLDKVYEKVCEYCDKFGAEFWQPPKLLQDLAEAGSTFAEFDKSRA